MGVGGEVLKDEPCTALVESPLATHAFKRCAVGEDAGLKKLEHLEEGAYACFGDATALGHVRTLAPGQACSESPSTAFGASVQKRAD